MTEPMLTVRQLAERLQVNPHVVYQMRRDGMPHLRTGTGGRAASLRFDWLEVKRWMEARQEKVA